MADVLADLRSYYEAEAEQGLRRELTGRRVELRDEFITLLREERRRSVVDFGAGPGGDVAGFDAAGMQALGLDLSHGNGVLAAANGLAVLQASLAAPPLRPASFQAGWSMSTLMHVPESDVPAALGAMAAVLEPGAPLFVGQWGGQLGDQIDTDKIEGQRRLFSLRSFERNCLLLSGVGQVATSELWPVGPPGWEYHLTLVRIGAGPRSVS